LQADDSNTRSAQGQRDYLAWRAQRDQLIATGSAPTLRLATATEIVATEARPSLPEANSIIVEQTVRVAGRPHGNRFGTLVHAVMARIALDANADAITQSATFYGRIVGATPGETVAAADAVIAALSSPIIKRARAALELRRESPLIVTLDDGLIIEGIADLILLEAHEAARRWVVVDFKTDVDLAPRLDEYRTQVALYIRALTRATNLPAIGVLLWL